MMTGFAQIMPSIAELNYPSFNPPKKEGGDKFVLYSGF